MPEDDRGSAEAGGDSGAEPALSLAGEKQLLLRWSRTADPAVKEELVRRFLPFARSLAMRYRGGAEPSDDLIQVASVGLIGAIDRFDPTRGVPFAAFAAPTILGELRRHFRDRVWTMRVPRGLQERIADVDDAIHTLTGKLERSPSVSDVAEHLGLDDSEVLEAIEASDARRVASLDQRASADPEAAPLAERLGEEDPAFELVEDREAVRKEIGGLTEIEREVLRLRFVEDLTQSKIAERVGYSQMHVSRLIRRALAQLREAAHVGPAGEVSDPDEAEG